MPEVYEWMCPMDLSAAARGYEEDFRMGWEQTLMQMRAWGSKLKYEDLFGAIEGTKSGAMSREEYLAWKDKTFGKRDG